MRRTYRLTACFVIVSILAFGLIAAHSATTWQKAAQLNTGRNQFAGAVVDGKIYVFGGNSKTGSSPLTSTEMFDPAAGKWVYEAENEDNGGWGVEELTGAAVNGKFYVFGGCSGGVINFDEVYDPVANAWTSLSPMPTTRSAPTAATYNGKIYVFGGYDDSSGTKIRYTVVEAYDPTTDSWESVTNMPQTLSSPAVAVVADKAYVIGGYDGSELVSDVSVYDFTTGIWTTSGLAPLPTPRVFGYASAVPTIDGKIYLIGGIAGTKESPKASNEVDIYDTASNTWQKGAPLPVTINGAFCATVNNEIFAIGGNTSASTSNGNNNATITPTVWVYNLLTPPGPPTGIKPTATGVGQATVSFKAPASTGSSLITGYTVTSNPAGGADSTPGSSSLSHIVTGLANGSPYTFTVTATNQDGMQATSKASSKIKTWSAPSQPKITSLKAGNEEVTVSFSTSKTDTGDPVSYTVTATATGQPSQTASGPKSPIEVNNLANNVTYTFTVMAANQVGSNTSPSKSIAPSAPKK